MSTFGRYTLVRRVGTGGMAEIWKAKAQGPAGFEKILAIKKVLPHLAEDSEFIEMFIAEAKLVATLVHPNIVQVFDFGQAGKREYFIAMEYVPGANLAMILKRITERGARLPMEVALYIAIETCKGLGYAHEKTDPAGRQLTIVHRDVSPQNVLVSFSGEVKVTDFGIAKVESALTRTAEGHVRGKLAYMSPEQANTRSLDARSDLFSLGIVLYELLTGRRLFYGSSSSEIFAKVSNFQVPTDADLVNIPFEVRTVLKTVLAPDPEERYQAAMELEHALMSALGPDGMVQARHALASIVQRLFDDERKLEMTSEIPGPVPSMPDDSPTEAPTGVGAASGQQVALSSRPTEARVPSNPSGLTMVPNTVRPVHRAEVLPAGPAARPVRQSNVSSYVFYVGGFLFALTAVALLGGKYLRGPQNAVVVNTPLPTPGWTAAPTQTAVAVADTPVPTPTQRSYPTPHRTPTARVVTTAAPTPTVAPIAGKGALTVKAKPWVEVWVDGKRVKDETPLRHFDIAAGRHTLRLVNAGLRYELVRTIEIQPDKELDVFVDATTRAIVLQVK